MGVSVFPVPVPPAVDPLAPPGAISRTHFARVPYGSPEIELNLPQVGEYAIKYTGPSAVVGASCGKTTRHAQTLPLRTGAWSYVKTFDANEKLRVGSFLVTKSASFINGTSPLYQNTSAASFQQTLPFSATAVCYFPAASLYVIGGSSGQLATSPDGFTWTTRTSPLGSGSVNGFTYSDSVLVAYGTSSSSSPVIASSTNGTTWTSSGITGITFRDGLFANGQFVIVGDSGSSRVSTNGTTWSTPASAPSSFTMSHVTFYNGRFAALCNLSQSDGGRVYYSDDPLSFGWTLVTTPRNGPGDTNPQILQGLVATSDGFVISNNAGVGESRVYKSKDAINWTVENLLAAASVGVINFYGQPIFRQQSGSTVFVEDPFNSSGGIFIQTWRFNGYDYFRPCDMVEGAAGTGRALALNANNQLHIRERVPISGTIEVYRVA